MRRRLLASVAAGMLALLASAQAASLDGITVANELGAVLAAERPCHLSYDTAAVEQYIATHVDEGDMGFSSMLQMMTEGQRYQMQSMTPATMTAFCAQTARVAKFNGFIR